MADVDQVGQDLELALSSPVAATRYLARSCSGSRRCSSWLREHHARARRVKELRVRLDTEYRQGRSYVMAETGETAKPGWLVATKVLIDSTKIMLPFVAGSFVFAVKYLAEAHTGRGQDAAKTLASSWSGVAACSFMLASFGLWTGVLPFCIRALRDHDERKFRLGQVCAQMGHICFFLAVVCVAIFLMSPDVDLGMAMYILGILVTVALATAVWMIIVRRGAATFSRTRS